MAQGHKKRMRKASMTVTTPSLTTRMGLSAIAFLLAFDFGCPNGLVSYPTE